MALWASLLPAAVRAEAPDAEAFFTPASDVAADLDPHKVYPQGRLFPLTGYGMGAERTASMGFTMAGQMYGRLTEKHLADAAEHNVGVVAGITGGWSKDDLREVSPDEIVQTIREQVEEVLSWEHSDRLSWWYLRPEELRSWRSHEIQYLKLAANTIRETDPQRRPVWMYDPGHRGVAGLIPTAEHLDVVGKGMYTNYAGQVHDRVWCRWTIDVQNQAIEQANPKAVSIAVPEAFRHPARYVEALAEDEQAALTVIRQWVRHDVYAALIQGAQGMVVFSLRERRVAPDSKDLPFEGKIHEAYYSAYAQIADELTGELGLGDVLLFGEQRDDVQIETLQGPSTLTLTYRDNDPVNYPSIGHRSMAYGQDRYLFLVNSANETVSAMVSDLPYGDDIEVYELFTDHTFSLGEGEFKVNMQPYEVRAYRLRWLRP